MQHRKQRNRQEVRDQLARLRYLELRQEARRVKLHGGRFHGLSRAESRQVVEEAERARTVPYPPEPMDWAWMWFPGALLIVVAAGVLIPWMLTQ